MSRRPDIGDPDLLLATMFEDRPATPGVSLRHRMVCFVCPIAPFRTVIDAVAECRLDENASRP